MEKVKLFFSRYFGKEWKWHWRHNSTIGSIYGAILNRLGMKLLNTGRKLIRKGGGSFRGEHYQNCSWCGGVQTRETGLHMSVSNKGMRCGCLPIECENQPKI